MNDEHGIAVQVAYGNFSYTTQVMGTPWSPDVFNDISKQAIRSLKEMVSELDGSDHMTVITGDNADDVFERLLGMTDESSD